MATFVLIHGAWAGAWEWREVERLLRVRGHDVTRPTQMLQLVPGDRDQNGLLRPPGRSTYVAVPVAPGCGWLIRTVRFCRNGLWRPDECTARRKDLLDWGRLQVPVVFPPKRDSDPLRPASGW